MARFLDELMSGAGESITGSAEVALPEMLLEAVWFGSVFI
jgi:hypothetical protein